MRFSRTRLSRQLALASVVSAFAVAVVCGAGLFSLDDQARQTRAAVERHLALLNDAAAFQSLFYQKGFVATYLLTHDPAWLVQLEASRDSFARWLQVARSGALRDDERELVEGVAHEYRDYDEQRQRVITLSDAGKATEANALLGRSQFHVEKLFELMERFERMGREESQRELLRSQQSLRRLGFLLVGMSLAGALASLAVGFLLARRIARPIYELQLQVESAAQRTHLRLEPDPDAEGLEALGVNVQAIIEKLEQTDAALVEHRRRLLQSEKLSAVGELSAKLSHEILNPLAGMKAAVQLLARAGRSDEAAVQETAEALDREIRRVEDLVRRLVDYAKPLSPRTQVFPVLRLVENAVEASRHELDRNRATLSIDIDPDLPPLEVDPLLMTQVLCNLLANAAQATPGGRVSVGARRSKELGRDEVCIEVSDDGPGIAPENLGRLFVPFFTTRPKGHGLGLAVSQNIVLEHGGRIDARNRESGRGAQFQVWIPLVR